MSWFKRMVRNWLNDDNIYVEETSRFSNKAGLAIRADSDSVESDPVLNFKVYSAVGGKIVEFRRYDRQRDRNDHQTYIITNDQDFGERIAKIATMENLKA
jgi:hypothetical protein